MKKLALPFIGLVGMASFLLQLEYLLVACEAVCLTGFVWVLVSKRVPIRTLPLLVSALALGLLAFSQMGIDNWARWIWPPSHMWLPDAPSQEELPAIARYLLYRPFTWFYRITDALTGICLAGILLPWLKHIAEKHPVTTSVVMAGLLLLWLAVISFTLKREGIIIGCPFAVYCITLMAIDLLSGKKSKAFYIAFLSVLALSLLLTSIVAITYHKHYYYGDIYVVIEWFVAYTAPLCSSLFYVVWPLYKRAFFTATAEQHDRAKVKSKN